jgi:glycosyltransferase involved in cell wall biosynthesis
VNLQRRVVCTGSIGEDALTGLYQVAHVLLAASKHEGFGLSVLEGMAAALPVVVPRQPPFTEYVPPHAAQFVDPTSPSDIASAVLELLDKPELATLLGQMGPDVARGFSWQRSALRHAQLYARALAL